MPEAGDPENEGFAVGAAVSYVDAPASSAGHGKVLARIERTDVDGVTMKYEVLWFDVNDQPMFKGVHNQSELKYAA